MIYYMDTDTLMRKYSKKSLEEINATNFIIISSKIHVTKDRDNVLIASHLFINGGTLKGVGLDLEPDSPLMVERFKIFLLKHLKSLALLVTMIECDLVSGETTILLCSPKELECGYMQALCDTVYDIFHYRISRYPKEEYSDPEDVIRRLLYYKKQIKKNKLRMMNDGERLRYVQKLSKKKLKKKLKKSGEDTAGLDKVELEQLYLEIFS